MAMAISRALGRWIAQGRSTARTFLAMTLVLGLPALAASCGVARSVDRDDPRVARLLQVAASINRTALGFTPIDANAPLRLEGKSQRYDAMLHFDGEISRTVAFRETADSYQWVFEQ
jgi:hypothetical protein